MDDDIPSRNCVVIGLWLLALGFLSSCATTHEGQISAYEPMIQPIREAFQEWKADREAWVYDAEALQIKVEILKVYPGWVEFPQIIASWLALVYVHGPGGETTKKLEASFKAWETKWHTSATPILQKTAELSKQSVAIQDRQSHLLRRLVAIAEQQNASIRKVAAEGALRPELAAEVERRLEKERKRLALPLLEFTRDNMGLLQRKKLRETTVSSGTASARDDEMVQHTPSMSPSQKSSFDWKAVLQYLLMQPPSPPSVRQDAPPPALIPIPGDYYRHQRLFTPPSTTECRWVQRLSGPVWQCR